MNLKEFQNKIISFREQVQLYRDILSESRDQMMPDIVKNFDIIKQSRSSLTKIYAALEKYIKIIGKDPHRHDGVWNVLYSAYDNAFSSDILLRVGPSLDAVLDDMDYISGKVESMNDNEFDELFSPKKESAGFINSGIVTADGGQGGDGDSAGKGGQGGQIIMIQVPESKSKNESLTDKINGWNFVNPVWLIYQLFKLAWKHKIISGAGTIIVGLIVAYVVHILGWNK